MSDVLSVVGASVLVGFVVYLVQEYKMDKRIREERLRRRVDDEIRKHKEEYLSKNLDERVDESNSRLSESDVESYVGDSGKSKD